jgi:uncharacterized protein HemY
LAWLLAICLDPRFHDPSRAVELAKKALDREPSAAPYWNTLGVAHYRAGNWNDAVTALEQSVKSGNGDSWNWFFLAMTYCRLGDKEWARMFYDQAIQWMEKKQPRKQDLRQELQRFRAETAELLGIKDQPAVKEGEKPKAKVPNP